VNDAVVTRRDRDEVTSAPGDELSRGGGESSAFRDEVRAFRDEIRAMKVELIREIWVVCLRITDIMTEQIQALVLEIRENRWSNRRGTSLRVELDVASHGRGLLSAGAHAALPGDLDAGGGLGDQAVDGAAVADVGHRR
jgi:hypothetical protein